MYICRSKERRLIPGLRFDCSGLRVKQAQADPFGGLLLDTVRASILAMPGHPLNLFFTCN